MGLKEKCGSPLSSQRCCAEKSTLRSIKKFCPLERRTSRDRSYRLLHQLPPVRILCRRRVHRRYRLEHTAAWDRWESDKFCLPRTCQESPPCYLATAAILSVFVCIQSGKGSIGS